MKLFSVEVKMHAAVGIRAHGDMEPALGSHIDRLAHIGQAQVQLQAVIAFHPQHRNGETVFQRRIIERQQGFPVAVIFRSGIEPKVDASGKKIEPHRYVGIAAEAVEGHSRCRSAKAVCGAESLKHAAMIRQRPGIEGIAIQRVMAAQAFHRNLGFCGPGKH